MDKLIYTAMSGARQIMERQATTTNNLANAATTGFRAQVDAFRAVPILGEGLPTRAFVADATAGADFTPGAVQHTGRALDVALQGKGWFAVQTADGGEAYTRHGSLSLSPNGELQTQSGLPVMGEGGAIAVPPDAAVSIAADGTVSAIQAGSTPGAPVILGRIKLVNPPEPALARGEDGLFRLRGGGAAEADPAVRLEGGALEGSNVNVAEAMVEMISLARQFEMQMSLLRNAESNDAKATQLLSLS